MKKFADRFHKENGFTLIEIIAAITLFSMIVGIISALTMFGFRSYHKISIENSLRDEADLIMSSIITELYTFGPSKIENTNTGLKLTKDSNANEVSIELVQEDELEGGNTKLIITNKSEGSTSIQADLRGSTIISTNTVGRECNVNNPCTNGLINIKLELTRHYDGRDYNMELVSKFGF